MQNGGGAGLQVSYMKPGGKYERFTKHTTRAKPFVIETGDYGMYVDVYKWNGQSLGTINARRNFAKWYKNGTPLVSHLTHSSDLWYSNDDDFAKEIPGFNKQDKYAVRFRGYFVAPKAGTYRFRTRSDDGSQLWIRENIKGKQQKTEKLIVNNDGNHGMRTREGSAQLKKGWNKMIVTFYENGGGAGLQCSVRVSISKGKVTGPGGRWVAIGKKMMRPLFRKGMKLEW